MPYAVLFAPIGSDDFQPLPGETYETGGEAAESMKALQAANAINGNGIRYKVRQVEEPGVDPNAWRQRERDHFYAGRYIEVPWHRAYWNDELRWEHYAHLSLKEPGKIAYTASPEHGRADRQTIIAPGRYLQRYFSNALSADDIERFAAEVSVSAGSCELHFTSDPDKIEEVYCNGPSSCMSHDVDDYRGHCHPVRAYGNSPDLQLAYIGTEERYTGRAIVWPEKKIYARRYGDTSRLRILLENAGYTAGYLSGARLTPLTDNNGNGYIMPYVDDVSYAAEKDGFLVLGQGGSIHCQSTDGVSNCEEEEDERATCNHCDERYDENEEGAYVGEIGEYWCDSCLSNDATCCEHDNDYYLDRRHSFHEVHAHRRWGGVGLTTLTIVDCNLEDAGAIYHEASGEYLDGDLHELVTALEEIAAAVFALPAPDDAGQLGLAFQTLTQEALAA